MQKSLLIITLLLLTSLATFAQSFALVDSYPSEGSSLTNLHGETLKFSFNEGVKKVIFYVHNVTANKQITSKMIDASAATKDLSYYFDPSVGNSDIYALPAGNQIEIRWTAYYSYNSSFSNNKAGEGTIHIMGNDANAKVLSSTVQFVSITPNPNSMVLSDSDGASSIPVTLSFNNTVASADAWIAISQGERKNLKVTIDDSTVTISIPTNAASGGGTCTLFVQARDAAYNIIGDREGTVSPIDGSLQFSYLSEIGLPLAQLRENGKELNEMASLVFTHTSSISLNNDISSGFRNIKIIDHTGTVVATGFSAGQFSNDSKTSLSLQLSTPIIANDKYTIEVPYGCFIMGEETNATKNKSAVYSVIVGSATDIANTVAGESATNTPVYNPLGQRLTGSAKGILIKNGKKYSAR